MLSSVVRLLRQVARALVTGDWSRQLAAGFGLGIVMGLVPNGSLIAVSLCVLLFSLRVNKGLEPAATGPVDAWAAPPREDATCAA